LDPVGRTVDGQFLGRVILPSLQIIGVVDDIKYYGPDSDAQPEVYVNRAQMPRQNINRAKVAVRTVGEPPSIISDVRTIFRDLDSDLRIDSSSSLEELVAQSQSLARPRVYAVLLTAFAGLALALAVVGIYGAMTYMVARRTHEIGIRMALGAPRHAVLHLVLKDGMALTSTGLLLGLVSAAIATRFIEKLLFGVSRLDLPTFGVASAILVVTAIVASFIPAHRATTVDPLVALRHD